MDDPYQRRRRGDQPTHQSSQSRFSASSRQSHSPTTRSSSDGAYRPSTNPSTQMSRGVAPAGVYGSYAPEPTAQFATNTLATSVLGYGVDYGHDARTPAQPAFAAYQAPNVMYNVPTPSPQAPVYDTPQFGQRPSSGLSIMTPDMASTCFGPDAGGGSASNLPPPAPGNHGAQAAPVYQQQHQQHSSSLGYEGGVAGGANLAQQGFRVAGGTGLGHEPEYATGRLEEKWVNYQQQLASIFQNITEGSLGTASDALLSVSNWLLTQAAELGLAHDDANLHADRMKLWNEFNNAWLALGYRQRELMLASEDESSPLQRRLMSEASIRKLGNELIRLCDGLERHGLVDYQYGVWEDQIESVLEDCLDLFEHSDVSR